MVKKFSVCLIVILLLIVSGCGEKNKLSSLEKDYLKSSDLIVTTEKTEYSKEDTVIEYTISNVSPFESGYGEYVYLNKLKDGEWYVVEFNSEDYVFCDIAWMLESQASSSRELNLANGFNLPLEDGEYRILIELGDNTAAISNTFTVK